MARRLRQGKKKKIIFSDRAYSQLASSTCTAPSARINSAVRVSTHFAIFSLYALRGTQVAGRGKLRGSCAIYPLIQCPDAGAAEGLDLAS